ncbi:hypothetical protein AB0L65_59805 [Nonomuraea sp. NPDC052116]|uniref:hypothetical protein n=1 Tax=Nonomuraea sp. NPDC052116 TaxID=3155665 RepID=UPI0034255796
MTAFDASLYNAPGRLPSRGESAAAHHDLDVRTILLEVGARNLVGGQEDLIIDIAAQR